jgi:hypothetical protein
MNKNNKSFGAAIIALLLCSINLTNLNAQPFDVGDKNLNLTIGFGTPWVLYNDYSTALPPITASFDYGFRDDIGPGVLSIGGIVGATTYKDQILNSGWIYEYGYKSTTFIMALRSTYHYQLVNKLDTYGGVHLGLRIERWREYGNSPPVFESRDIDYLPVFSLFGGARYYFTDQIAAMLELGYSIAFINVGICYKL